MTTEHRLSSLVKSPGLLALAVLYLTLGGWTAVQTIVCGNLAVDNFEQILTKDNMQNNGALFLERFDKEHPLLGTLASSTIRKSFELPPTEQAEEELKSTIPRLHKRGQAQASLAERWSWGLVCASVLYAVILVGICRTYYDRRVVFGLILITVLIFAVGITAPALIIWTKPSIPIETGRLEFVLQHQVRSITSVIKGLITSGHWIIGLLILLFSIITPLVKALLIFLATLTRSLLFKKRLVTFLHAIGKWSMADVFVAGVLLALFSLKSQESTKTLASLGLYFFIGYCLLSIMTTSILEHTGETENGSPSAHPLSGKVLAIAFTVIFLILGTGGYMIYKTPSASLPRNISSPANQ